MAWRQTPFLRLKENGYDFQWPEETTAGRGALAVDGFAYNAATCKPKGAHSQAIRFMQHFTDHSGVVSTFTLQPVDRDVPPEFEGTSDAISHLVRRATKLQHEEPKLGVLFRATGCDAEDPSQLRECLKQSKMSAKDKELAAAVHVLMTGPMGLPEIQTPFVSCTASVTTALMFATQHKLTFLWRFCPTTRDGIYDMRSQWGIREVNRLLPKDARVSTKEGHSASVSWAKFKNKDSGLNFDQVLVGRASLRSLADQIQQVRVADLPSEVWDLVDRQTYLWDAETNSYSPHSKFLRLEERLRKLVFPNARPPDLACLGRQRTNPIDRHRRKEPNLVQSSESEIEDPDEGPPVTRKRSASRERSSRRSRRRRAAKSPGRRILSRA